MKKQKNIETLKNIIYSDDYSDMYEANLMRRLDKLLFFDSIIFGGLKVKVKSNIKK